MRSAELQTVEPMFSQSQWQRKCRTLCKVFRRRAVASCRPVGSGWNWFALLKLLHPPTSLPPPPHLAPPFAPVCPRSVSCTWLTEPTDFDGLLQSYTSLCTLTPEAGALRTNLYRPDYRKHLSPEILYILYKWFAPQTPHPTPLKKNPSNGLPRTRTLVEFKEFFPDQFFTICK